MTNDDKNRLAAFRHLVKNDENLDREHFWKTDHIEFLLRLLDEKEAS